MAVSYSMGTHTEAFCEADDSSSSSGEDAETQAPTATVTTSPALELVSADLAAPDDCCEVCLGAPRVFALVPYGHARFCESCALGTADLAAGCPVCRTDMYALYAHFL